MIEQLLIEALENTQKGVASKPAQRLSQLNHAAISRRWVKEVADRFRQIYPEDDRYRVFSRDYEEHQKIFRTNEYLYDITVIRTGILKSASGRKELEYPQETLWHVESEFQSNDSRASIIDFGKLMMSSAKSKLLVLPAGGAIEQWARNRLPETEAYGIGTMFLGFVPHPREWASHKDLEVRTMRIW